MSLEFWDERHWDAFQAGIDDDVIANDPWVAALFDLAVYNTEQWGPEIYDKEELMMALDQYLYDEYDIIFEDIFDWDAFREAYG